MLSSTQVTSFILHDDLRREVQMGKQRHLKFMSEL